MGINDIESKKILSGLLEVLNEKKGENITVFDVENITTVAKYIIIATANSNVHSAGLARSIIDFFKNNDLGNLLFSKGPDTNNPWILIDGTDYVIHIFLAETRNFYSLEKLFFKAKLLFQS